MSGDVTLQALKRQTFLQDRDTAGDPNGTVIAGQDYDDVFFTGGTISGVDISGLTNPLAISDGGTGQTTALAAINALLPSQTGNSGKFLTTDGTDPSWSDNPLGTVTSVSGVDTNGFAWSIADATTTPAITLSTTITGILEGNGTAISANAPLTDLAGNWTAASASSASSLTFDEDTDNGSNAVTLIAPASVASDAVVTLPDATATLSTLALAETLTNKTIDGNNNTLTVLAATQLSGVVPTANGGAGTVNGILKANGSGTVSQATAGTDYVTPTGSETLTNKTLTSPVINTGISGTAILDDDTFATASSTTVATSESIKAYVDTQVASVSPTDWTAYAPSTQGFGTISSSNVLYRIIGNHMEIMGSFTTGTVTGDEAQVSLPSGYQVNGTLITSICIAGMCVRSSTGGSPINTLITGSDTFINFGKQDAILAGLTPLAANSIVGNTVSISFHATIPFTTT